MDRQGIRSFLRESNAIENVYDDEALSDYLDAWEYLKDADELTEDKIIKSHEIILKNRQPDITGQYRDCYVRIGNDVPPQPDKIDDLMRELLEKQPSNENEAIFWHIIFEKIHPFRDGNGRIGRLIYLWHSLSKLDIDPICWKRENVSEYYKLFSIDEDPASLLRKWENSERPIELPL